MLLMCRPQELTSLLLSNLIFLGVGISSKYPVSLWVTLLWDCWISQLNVLRRFLTSTGSLPLSGASLEFRLLHQCLNLIWFSKLWLGKESLSSTSKLGFALMITSLIWILIFAGCAPLRTVSNVKIVLIVIDVMRKTNTLLIVLGFVNNVPCLSVLIAHLWQLAGNAGRTNHTISLKVGKRLLMILLMWIHVGTVILHRINLWMGIIVRNVAWQTV